MSLLPLLFSALLSGAPQTPTKPLFPGDEALNSCVVELPLTYAARDRERYIQAAKFLEDQELVLVTWDRKAGTGTYQRVFVVAETMKDGSTSVYLEHAADRMKSGGLKEALFPRIKPATQRFYNAACFDEQVAVDSALQSLLTEQAR